MLPKKTIFYAHVYIITQQRSIEIIYRKETQEKKYTRIFITLRICMFMHSIRINAVTYRQIHIIIIMHARNKSSSKQRSQSSRNGIRDFHFIRPGGGRGCCLKRRILAPNCADECLRVNKCSVQ